MAFAAMVPWKYVAILAAAAFAFWFVRDMGVQAERQRWEIAMTAERDRQSEVVRAYEQNSRMLASKLLNSETDMNKTIRRLQDEARNAAGADRACLDADSIMRLNTLSGSPATE